MEQRIGEFEQGIRRFSWWTGIVFVLLLAFAGAIWGAEFVLRPMDLSLRSRADAIFIFFVLALLFAFYIFRNVSSQLGPAVRFYVPRPADLAAKDGVTALWRIENVPYAINDSVVLTLNERGLSDPAIYADVVDIEQHLFPENEEWMTATLKLHDPNDFERLRANQGWYIVRENAVPSQNEPLQPVPVAVSPKTLP
jgi:hypothetical protein